MTKPFEHAPAVYHVKQNVDGLKGCYFSQGVVVANDEDEAFGLLEGACEDINTSGDPQADGEDATLERELLAFEVIGPAGPSVPNGASQKPRVLCVNFGTDNDF